MASRQRLHACADFLNRYNSFISFRITKIANNGRNNLSHSAANYSSSTQSLPAEPVEEPPVQEKRGNRAVQAYLQRSRDYDAFMKEQLKAYQMGKTFLARIMGKKSDTFSQKHIDEAIRYLFPSALHEKLARPMFKHPELLYAKRKEAQFDESGRPFHYLFYTTKPNFSQALHECAMHLQTLNEKIKKMDPTTIHPKVPLNVTGSEWLSKELLERKLLEKLLDIEYEKFIEALDRLINHPYSFEATSFIMEFRTTKDEKKIEIRIPKKEMVSKGVYCAKVTRCRRKTCDGKVKLINPGTGKLSINGLSLIDFFDELQPRQEVGKFWSD